MKRGIEAVEHVGAKLRIPPFACTKQGVDGAPVWGLRTGHTESIVDQVQGAQDSTPCGRWRGGTSSAQMGLRESGERERLVRMPVEMTADRCRWPSARGELWPNAWRTEARLNDPFDERLKGRVALEWRQAAGLGLPHHCRCGLRVQKH